MAICKPWRYLSIEFNSLESKQGLLWNELYISYFLWGCEWQDQDRVCVGSSKIDFQLAGHTFYLAHITWIFDILDPVITSPGACLMRNDGHLYNQTIAHTSAAYADLISNLNSGNLT